jgi:hypothetical protein
MKQQKKDYRLIIWIMIFGIGVTKNGFVEIYTDSWIVNLVNGLLLLGILFQMTYFVSILIGKRQYFTVIERIPSYKEKSGFILGAVLSLKRKYFYVINEEGQKLVVSSFFLSEEKVFRPSERIRGYKGFSNKVKIIDWMTIVMRAVVLAALVILLFLMERIFQWLKLM